MLMSMQELPERQYVAHGKTTVPWHSSGSKYYWMQEAWKKMSRTSKKSLQLTLFILNFNCYIFVWKYWTKSLSWNEKSFIKANFFNICLIWWWGLCTCQYTKMPVLRTCEYPSKSPHCAFCFWSGNWLTMCILLETRITLKLLQA